MCIQEKVCSIKNAEIIGVNIRKSLTRIIQKVKKEINEMFINKKLEGDKTGVEDRTDVNLRKEEGYKMLLNESLFTFADNVC